MSSHLTEPPEIVHRPAQPYVGVQETVTMQTIGRIADRIPEVIGRIAERGVEPTGAAFLRYLVIDMERELRIEAGVPVEEHPPTGADEVAGVLPAGRYVVTTVHGHPDVLEEATGELIRWAQERDLVWDAEPGPEGERWGCRLEIYLSDPAEEPDPDRWRTQLAFRLRD